MTHSLNGGTGGGAARAARCLRSWTLRPALCLGRLYPSLFLCRNFRPCSSRPRLRLVPNNALGGGGAYEYMPVHAIGPFPRHAVAMYYPEWWALLLLPCYHLYS